MTIIVNDLNIEQATAFILVIIGFYIFIGGFGATLYAAYCNTAIIFIFLLVFIFKVHGDDSDSILGRF